MKTRLALTGAVVLAGVIGLLAQQDRSPTRDLMRKKLDHAQSVLEGITMENFDLIAGNAARLGALSDEAPWRASDTPEYLSHSRNFRRNVEALKKAARERDMDAAVLAYTKLTFNCVECHKYLRNLRVAALGPDQTLSDLLIDSSELEPVAAVQ